MYARLQILCLFRVTLIKNAIFVNNFLKPLVSPIFMRGGASAVFKGHGRFSSILCSYLVDVHYHCRSKRNSLSLGFDDV